VPHIIAPGSFIGFFLALFSGSVLAGTTPALLQSPASKQDLNFAVGERGLTSLSFNGQSLLVSPASGELQPEKSVFRAALDAILPRSASQVATPKKKADTVDLSCPWGRASARTANKTIRSQ
jgi:hypothetical protein